MLGGRFWKVIGVQAPREEARPSSGLERKSLEEDEPIKVRWAHSFLCSLPHSLDGWGLLAGPRGGVCAGGKT